MSIKSLRIGESSGIFLTLSELESRLYGYVSGMGECVVSRRKNVYGLEIHIFQFICLNNAFVRSIVEEFGNGNYGFSLTQEDGKNVLRAWSNCPKAVEHFVL